MSRVFKVDYIPDPDRGRPLWNAKIYVGIPNEDPTIPSNQIQLTGDIGFPVGQSIPVPQPVRTNKGGVTVYNNSPLDLNAPGQQYAIAIYDRNDNLIYNFPQVDGSVAMNTTSQEEVTGLTIWPEVGEAVIGQTIPVGTDAIRYPFNGRSTLFTIKPPVAVTGLITDITINSSGIGTLEVDNSDVYALAEFNSYIAANDGDSQLAGGAIWPLSSQDSLSLGAQSTVVSIDADRFRVNTGSEVEILYLWEPSGTLPTAPFTIEDITSTSNGVYEFTIDGSTYEFFNQENFDANITTLRKVLPGDDLSAEISRGDGIQMVDGTYTLSTTPDVSPSQKIRGAGNTKTIVNITSSFIDNNNTSDTDIEVSDIQLNGSGKNDGVTAIVRDGTVNSSREHYNNIAINSCEVGIEHSAGWQQFYDRLFIRNCGTGFIGKEAAILPGWGGSGYVMMNSYFGGNDIGCDDSNVWNTTYINPIFEDNINQGYKQDTRGTPTVMINPWFEDNGLTPQWRRPTVVLGGRDVNFDDVDLFAGDPTRAIGHFFGSLRIFRDGSGNTNRLLVDGQGVKSFQAVYSDLGWAYETITSSVTENMMKVSQGDAFGLTFAGALTTGDELLTFGARVHETGGALDTMPTTGLKIQGSTASGRGFVRPVLQSGVYFSDGSPSNDIGDRWRLEWTGEFTPVTDNTYDIGLAGTNRVRDLYIVNAPVVGSDHRIKDDVKSIPQELLDFALSVEIKQYRLKDRVRNHYGIVITEDFLSSLSSITDIDYCGAFCKSVFTDDEDNPIDINVHGAIMGDIWQVRYDEWQNILLEAMRRKINSM